MMPRAPRRPLSPLLLRRVASSNINKNVIARAAGFPAYATFYSMLRCEKVIATPLTVKRLMRVAELVGFPLDEVFLDEPARPAKRTDDVGPEAAAAEAEAR